MFSDFARAVSVCLSALSYFNFVLNLFGVEGWVGENAKFKRKRQGEKKKKNLSFYLSTALEKYLFSNIWKNCHQRAKTKLCCRPDAEKGQFPTSWNNPNSFPTPLPSTIITLIYEKNDGLGTHFKQRYELIFRSCANFITGAFGALIWEP